MIRIRIKETDVIQYIDKQYQFKKQKRHGSIVKSFNLLEGKINFIDAPLKSKMIPKRFYTEFANLPFKTIKTDNNNFLFFQDPSNTLQLLKFNNGWIQSVNFDELTEDDDIIVFDDNEKEWAISGIKSIEYFNTTTEKEDIEIDLKELTMDMYAGYSNSLSPYMSSIETGLIVNNIFII